MGQGLGTGSALEAREGRQDQPDALAPLRAGRRRGLREDDQCLQAGDRRRRRRDERIVRGHSAESIHRREHGLRPRHGVGPLFAAAPVPGEVHGSDRRRELSRQEVRRLDAVGRGLRQVRQQVDRHPDRDHGRPHELPHLLHGEGGLQGISRRTRPASSNCAARSKRTIRRPASHSATPRATPTPGCTGRSGRTAATSSTRTTRSSSTRPRPRKPSSSSSSSTRRSSRAPHRGTTRRTTRSSSPAISTSRRTASRST